MSIQLGVVGWASDTATPQDDDALSGVSLVRVTLYDGHDVLAPLQAGKAFGSQILAQPIGPVAPVYTAGMRVVVAIPDGLDATPGAAVLLGTLAQPVTDFVALAQRVLDELTAVKNAFNGHLHGPGTLNVSGVAAAGVTAGPSQNPAGIPLVTYSPSSVASSLAKAK